MKDLVKLLKEVMAADEGVRFPKEVGFALADAGYVRLCGCSDGDYMDLTEKGKEVLEQ